MSAWSRCHRIGTQHNESRLEIFRQNSTVCFCFLSFPVNKCCHSVEKWLFYRASTNVFCEWLNFSTPEYHRVHEGYLSWNVFIRNSRNWFFSIQVFFYFSVFIFHVHSYENSWQFNGFVRLNELPGEFKLRYFCRWSALIFAGKKTLRQVFVHSP